MSDLISRQAVLKLLSTIPPEEAMTKAMLIQSVKQMDSETVTECNNLISRQAAIDAVAFGITYAKAFDLKTGEAKNLFEKENEALAKAVERIKELPSAQPKTGRWEAVNMDIQAWEQTH